MNVYTTRAEALRWWMFLRDMLQVAHHRGRRYQYEGAEREHQRKYLRYLRTEMIAAEKFVGFRLKYTDADAGHYDRVVG